MMESIVNRKILYVAGYGRSGSTLLCAVLGGNDHSAPVGEFKSLFTYYSEGRTCACGKKLSECGFWHAVMIDFKNRLPEISLEEAADVTMRMDSFRNWLSLRHRNTDLEKSYSIIWQTLIDCVCDRSGCNVIVDASKSASAACNRVAVLSRVIEVQHVHLVRDPRSVMSSMVAAQVRRLKRHGIKPVPMRGVRTLLSWIATNSYIELMHLFRLQPVHSRVSYERLTNTPVKCMDQLENDLDLEVKNLKTKLSDGALFKAGHIFSGDFQRLHGDYAIRSEAPKWPDQLSLVQKVLAYITFPIGRFYGFFK